MLGERKRVMAMVRNKDCSDFLRWAAERGISDVLPCSATASPPLRPETVGSSCRAPCNELGYSLRIATFPNAGGRGLAASRNLTEGELILRVPKSALMSMLSAKEDPQLAKAMTLHPKLSSNQILTVHLLNEVAKEKLSTWYTYLVELPRLHHTLAHFSQSAIQALQVEDATWVARNAVRKSVMDWEATKDFMQDIRLCRKFRSLNAWLWASATVSSRTLHVPWDEAGTLCPIGDLFNYAPPGELYFDAENLNKQVAGTLESAEDIIASESADEFSCYGVTIRDRLRDGGYEPEREEYCFYARQAYKPEQQVLLCYGQYNNLELLEYYGFCMAQNPNDIVDLGLPNPTEFGSCSDHLPMNSSGGLYIEVNGTPSFSLLAGLRLRAIQPPLRKARGHIALMGEQISKESDILVYQWLQRKCESLLACLPTSLEDDLALVELASSVQGLSSVETLYKCLSEEYDRTGQVAALQQKSGDLNLREEHILHELNSFLSSSRVLKNDKICKTTITTGEDSNVERWKLALEWRIGYKRILHRCCLLCAKKVRQLMSS